jgi:hypothetical protein
MRAHDYGAAIVGNHRLGKRRLFGRDGEDSVRIDGSENRLTFLIP